MSFADKVAIVTGAGGGLGRSYALAFAQRGAKVVVNDIGALAQGAGGRGASGREVAKEIVAAGGDALANDSDLLKGADIERLVAETLDRFGRIDILVNNAGFLRDRSFAKMTLDDLEAVLDIHLSAVAALTHRVWPLMIGQGYGRIVMTTSSSGLYGNHGQANYAAGKLGQIGLVNVLRLEGQKHNVRVNAIAPGAFTPMTEALMPPDVGALLAPDHVSAGVLYLCSDDAPTGEILSACGGHFATVAITSTQGIVLPSPVTPEAIAAHWAAITDPAEPRRYKTASDEIRQQIERVMAAKQAPQ